MPVNPFLMQEVKRAMAAKRAFVPAGATSGAPPMDPAAMGGAPPMDPAMAAPPPAPSGPSADDIRQLIKEELQSAMSGGAAGGAAAPKSKGSAKVDPAQILEYMERVQKLIVNLYESLGLNLPYNILDKPAPEGAEGEAVAAEPAKEKGTDENVSGIPPIKPIEPMGGSKQAAVKTQAEALRYMLEAISKGR